MVVDEVKNVLEREICFCDDNLKTIKREKIEKIFKDNDIILMENIRFYEEEETFDQNFSKKLLL